MRRGAYAGMHKPPNFIIKNQVDAIVDGTREKGTVRMLISGSRSTATGIVLDMMFRCLDAVLTNCPCDHRGYGESRSCCGLVRKLLLLSCLFRIHVL
jgi:hypothetical protein